MYPAINFDSAIKDQFDDGNETWYVVEPGDSTRYVMSFSDLAGQARRKLHYGPDDRVIRATMYFESGDPRSFIVAVYSHLPWNRGVPIPVDAREFARPDFNAHRCRVMTATINRHLGVAFENNPCAHEFEA